MNHKWILSFIFILAIAACQPAPAATESVPEPVIEQEQQPQAQSADASTAEVQVKAEVWADNWFAFYLADQLVKEDSVPITTERSFNAETFTFTASYPMTLNFIAKDFKENDTGLEYIGSNHQQMGDGGLIAQFTNAQTGELIAVTSADWVCTVIHEAPLDKACENETNPVAGTMPCGFTSLAEPAGWMLPTFDSSSWSPASIYSAAQVSPKDGYDQISWDVSAQFIWGPDLETNNTVLCTLTITE